MEVSRDANLNRYFFLAVIIALGWFIFQGLSQFFSAFLTALVFYILSKPVVLWLIQKKHWKKSWASVVVIIVSFFIILLPMSLMVSMLFKKMSGMAANPDAYLNTIKTISSDLHNRFGIELVTDKNIATLQSFATNLISSVLNEGFSFLSTIIMMYFFLYFMIDNINRMEAAAIVYMPFDKEKVYMFGNELVSQTIGNAVGIPLIAVAQGICSFIGYTIAGVEDPGFWAVITGFSSVVPVIGTALAWIPASVFLFIQGHNGQGIFLLIWSLVVLGLTDNVIRFLLAKRMADVHPVITVLGVIFGMKYFGFMGIIFGPLLISYFIILLKIYYLEYRKPTGAKPVTKRKIIPDYVKSLMVLSKKENKKQ